MFNEISLEEVIGALTKDVKSVHRTLEADFFDYLALYKHKTTRAKLDIDFFNREVRVFCGSGLSNLDISVEGVTYSFLNEGFLKEPIDSLPKKCIYFLLNNDIGSAIAEYKILYKSRPCSLFVIWDWDSQHWIEMSCTLAAYCDFYVPVASENIYTISHFNPFLLGPVFVGVNQWPRKFITDNIELLVRSRSDSPYGPHVPYSAYARRIRAIATLNQHFSDVRFTDQSYKHTSEIDMLRDWSAHKAHWIIPVRSGMPIRIFNCLATGGIPIVPAFYQSILESSDLPSDVIYYETVDLLEPYFVLGQANERFDQQGIPGLIKRIGNFLDAYHIDSRCASIFTLLKQKFSRIIIRD